MSSLAFFVTFCMKREIALSVIEVPAGLGMAARISPPPGEDAAVLAIAPTGRWLAAVQATPTTSASVMIVSVALCVRDSVFRFFRAITAISGRY